MDKLKKYSVLCVGILLMALTACSESQRENEAEQAEEQAATSVRESLPVMSNERWQTLVTGCTSMEMTFYKVGLSISATSCAPVLPYISRNAPASSAGEEFGHVMFLIQGEMFAIAKVVLEENSGYMRFDFEDGPNYQMLNAEGLNYFTNLQTQLMKQPH